MDAAAGIFDRLGALWRRLHVFNFDTVQADGVVSRWTEDLQPIPSGEVDAGRLLELHSILDHRHPVDAGARVRFDLYEEDVLLFTGLDDQVISLLGTNPLPPPDGFPTEQRQTRYHELTPEQTAVSFVEEFKRTHPDDYERTILVLADRPAEGNRETHVVTWWRAQAIEDPNAQSEFYFVLNLGGTVEDAPRQALRVLPAAPGVALRLSGQVVDASPLDPAQPEPLPDVEVQAAGRVATTGDAGTFTLDARLPIGDHIVEVGRGGVDPLRLTANVTVAGDGRVTLAMRDPASAILDSATTAAASTETTVLRLALPDPLRLRVHKLRGTVVWPDTRFSANPNVAYAGTPLPDRRVYILPLREQPTALQRPVTSRQWAELKDQPGVLRSARPGRSAQDEPTSDDGVFEVRFVDLSVGRRYLVWVESPDPGAPAPGQAAPEVVVRTLHRELLRLQQLVEVDASDLDALGRHLIDHSYNLTGADALTWIGDSLRVVNWQPDPLAPDPGIVDPRLVRPDPRAKTDYDAAEVGGAMTVERVQYDPAQRLATGLRLQVLPLVPVQEPPDRQSATARALARALGEAFPGGNFRDRVRWVLDARRVPHAVLAANPAGPTAWLAPWDADPATPTWQQHRLCELLEKTFVVSPQIRGRTVAAAAPVNGQPTDATHARWYLDAVTLADQALISVPAVPDQAMPNAVLDGHLARAVVANRRLEAAVVPLLEPVSLRRTALTALRHIYLAPGHGFYPNPPNAINTPAWFSERTVGWQFGAGEDETGAIVSGIAYRIFDRHRLRLSTSREVVDLTLPGVTQPGGAMGLNFIPSPNIDFLRLWQQNPIYYLGSRNVTVGGVQVVTGTYLQQTAGRNRRVDAARARLHHAAALANDPVRQLDLFVGVHTNASFIPAPPFIDVTRNARGTHALYLDVDNAGAEGNIEGRRFGGHLVDAVVARCGTRRQDRAPPVPGTRSVRTNGGSIFELRGSFPHWEEQPPPPLDEWQRQRRMNLPAAGNWTQPSYRHPSDMVAAGGPPLPVFPRRLPVALLEIGFHNNPDEAALLAAPWFRRRAGEAIVIGCERQLREDQGQLTRRDLHRMLGTTFGQSTAVRGLTAEADDRPIGGNLARYVATVTGVTPVVVGGSLAVAADAIDTARDRFTRARLVTLLETMLARTAGYPAGDAEIGRYVTGVILAGDAVVSRPGDPVTRAEAGALIAAALGLDPASLQTVYGTRFGAPPGVTLLEVVPDPETFLPELEADPAPATATSLRARLEALAPTDCYRVADIFLANGRLRRLSPRAAPHRYTIHDQTPVAIVAETRGVPWRATESGVRFTATDGRGFREVVACAGRTPTHLWSRAWTLAVPPRGPGGQECLLEVAVQHATAGWQTIGSQRVRIEVL